MSSLDYEGYIPVERAWFAPSRTLRQLFFAAIVAEVAIDTIYYEAGSKFLVSQLIAVKRVLRDGFEVGRHKVGECIRKPADGQAIALDRKSDLGGAQTSYGSQINGCNSRQWGHDCGQQYMDFRY